MPAATVASIIELLADFAELILSEAISYTSLFFLSKYSFVTFYLSLYSSSMTPDFCRAKLAPCDAFSFAASKPAYTPSLIL